MRRQKNIEDNKYNIIITGFNKEDARHFLDWLSLRGEQVFSEYLEIRQEENESKFKSFSIPNEVIDKNNTLITKAEFY